MVQAILDGRKTQTRRVVKVKGCKPFIPPSNWDKEAVQQWTNDYHPYGKPGDILWVRETWCWNGHYYVYKTDHEDMPFRWKPSIHMPFAAARVFLRIKSVRVERLQQISEEDSIHEGIGRFTKDETVYKYGLDGWEWGSMGRKPSDAFKSLWQSINGPESWDANPWVWVIEFERITREEALNV